MPPKQARKPRKKAAARRVSSGGLSNIPFRKKEIVACTTFHKKVGDRILTKTTKIRVPLATPVATSTTSVATAPSEPSDPLPPPTDQKKTRKTPKITSKV